jgi:hypothetical protein
MRERHSSVFNCFAAPDSDIRNAGVRAKKVDEPHCFLYPSALLSGP